MAKLLYQGHASVRITTDDGKVIYIDPCAGAGYKPMADIILITHQHGDHNQIRLIKQKPDCIVITNSEALADGVHNSFNIGNVAVEAVEAYNKNHNPKECVGYIISFDGLKIYFSGDTSKTTQMDAFSKRELDYAFLCCDGIYNMDLDEAAECAGLIGAKHNVPIHISPNGIFDIERALRFNVPNKIILKPGQKIKL